MQFYQSELDQTLSYNIFEVFKATLDGRFVFFKKTVQYQMTKMLKKFLQRY